MTTDIRPGIDLGPDFPLRRNQPKIQENNYENNDLFSYLAEPDFSSKKSSATSYH